MVVIRPSVRSLQASSGLSGRGHYHWLIRGFWSILAALRISHFYTHTHTHNGLLFRYDCCSPLPYRVRAMMGSSHEEAGEGEWCDWVLSRVTSPLGFWEDDIWVRRSEPNISSDIQSETKPKKQMLSVHTSRFKSDVGASRPVFTDVCVLFYLRDEKAWKSLARLISE